MLAIIAGFFRLHNQPYDSISIRFIEIESHSFLALIFTLFNQRLRQTGANTALLVQISRNRIEHINRPPPHPPEPLRAKFNNARKVEQQDSLISAISIPNEAPEPCWSEIRPREEIPAHVEVDAGYFESWKSHRERMPDGFEPLSSIDTVIHARFQISRDIGTRKAVLKASLDMRREDLALQIQLDTQTRTVNHPRREAAAAVREFPEGENDVSQSVVEAEDGVPFVAVTAAIRGGNGRVPEVLQEEY